MDEVVAEVASRGQRSGGGVSGGEPGSSLPNVCKDAGEDRNHARRPVDESGWCHSCRGARKRARRRSQRHSSVSRLYGLSPDDLERLRAALPIRRGKRVCPGCEISTGAAKALAVDHDHELERQGWPKRETVRGLLCGPCNQIVGRMGDDPVRLIRLGMYLVDPPAPRVLGTRGMDRSGHSE